MNLKQPKYIRFMPLTAEVHVMAPSLFAVDWNDAIKQSSDLSYEKFGNILRGDNIGAAPNDWKPQI